MRLVKQVENYSLLLFRYFCDQIHQLTLIPFVFAQYILCNSCRQCLNANGMLFVRSAIDRAMMKLNVRNVISHSIRIAMLIEIEAGQVGYAQNVNCWQNLMKKSTLQTNFSSEPKLKKKTFLIIIAEV